MLGTTRSRRSSALVAVMLVAVMLVAAASGAAAQSAIYGAGLQAWLGCWSADPGPGRGGVTPSVVCITPTARGDVAELLTVEEGRIVGRETLDATGRQRPIDAARCTGVRSGSWSRDGRRLFVRSAGTCAGVPSSTSGLLAITADGDWLDVEGIFAGGGSSVRVARYRPVAVPTSLPIATRATLRAQALATQSVRVAAAAPVRAEDVLDAARAVDSAVVQTWILERAQRFEITESEIASLVGAGLPARVAGALGAVADAQSVTVVRGAADPDGGVARTTMADEWYAPQLGLGWGYVFPGGRYGSGYRDPRHGGHGGHPGHASPPAPAGVTLRLGKPRG